MPLEVAAIVAALCLKKYIKRKEETLAFVKRMIAILGDNHRSETST